MQPFAPPRWSLGAQFPAANWLCDGVPLSAGDKNTFSSKAGERFYIMVNSHSRVVSFLPVTWRPRNNFRSRETRVNGLYLFCVPMTPFDTTSLYWLSSSAAYRKLLSNLKEQWFQEELKRRNGLKSKQQRRADVGFYPDTHLQFVTQTFLWNYHPRAQNEITPVTSPWCHRAFVSLRACWDRQHFFISHHRCKFDHCATCRDSQRTCWRYGQ